MKIILLIFVCWTSALCAGTQHIVCSSSGEKGLRPYRIEFLGHPSKTQKTLLVEYYNGFGDLVRRIDGPINGFADQGFIKVSFPGIWVSPITQAVASIYGEGRPEGFKARYSQWIEVQGRHETISILDDELDCKPKE